MQAYMLAMKTYIV